MVKVNDKLYKLHPDAETEEDLFELYRKITHTVGVHHPFLKVI